MKMEMETQSYHELCPARALKPRFHYEIDAWLNRLGGARARELLDWIEFVPNTRYRLPVLLIEGPPGVGKSLLARGLARLWILPGPARAIGAFQGFNGGLLDSPVAHDTETDVRDQFAALVALAGEIAFVANRKGLPPLRVWGTPRFIIETNEVRVPTKDVLHVRVEGSAQDHASYRDDVVDTATFLKRRDVAPWVERDWIACHALWLREHRRGQPTYERPQ